MVAGRTTHAMPSRSDTLARMADEDLMALVADADADAYEVVYDRHADAAFALAHRILGSRAAADDACQDAWMAAWRSASRYDPRLGSVRSWLLTIVHHRAIDHVRRMTRLRDRTVADDAAAERVAGSRRHRGARARARRARRDRRRCCASSATTSARSSSWPSTPATRTARSPTSSSCRSGP